MVGPRQPFPPEQLPRPTPCIDATDPTCRAASPHRLRRGRLIPRMIDPPAMHFPASNLDASAAHGKDLSTSGHLHPELPASGSVASGGGARTPKRSLYPGAT